MVGPEVPVFRYGRNAVALWSLTGVLAAHAAAILVLRWNSPLLGMHAFRQTQTAISAYWMLRGSPWLAYETPVLGPPWSVPFEFPLFQLLVAGLVKLTGIPLDPAGRLVSHCFLLLTIYPAAILIRSYTSDRTESLIFAILLLACPVYLYWGTAFMIESCALFFSVAFVAAVNSVGGSDSWRSIIMALVCGTVAALVKITTFAAFYCIAAGLLIWHCMSTWRSRRPLRSVLLISAGMTILPVVAFSAWAQFASDQRIKNPRAFTLVLSNQSMHTWTFGTWEQLLSGQALQTIGRDLAHTLGGITVLLILFASLILFRGFFRRHDVTLLALALCAFLFPFGLFTNLYIQHNYYYAENAVFLLFAAAIVIGRFFAVRFRLAGWALLALVVGSQLLWFYGYFAKDIRHPLFQPLLAVAMNVKANTDPGSIVVIYGQQWSPAIPYYTERRALMEPEWIPIRDAIAPLHELNMRLDGHPVQAVVRCPSERDDNREYQEVFSNLDRSYASKEVAGCRIYFMNARNRLRP